MLQDLLASDDSFFHIYDRSFAKEALDLVVREQRIATNRASALSTSPAVSPAIHIPANITAPLPHSPSKTEIRKSIHR